MAIGGGNDGQPLEPHDHAARVIEPGPRRYPPPLDAYLGLKIKRICHNELVTNPGAAHFNHCAHFVCHVMRWNHIPGALKCSFLGHHDTPGVHVRVNEVFNYAPNRTLWVAGAAVPDPCLIVATVAANVIAGPQPSIGTHDRKHLGLHYQGKIWHFSTSHDQVFADTPHYFRVRKTGDYGKTTVFYSSDLVRT